MGYDFGDLWMTTFLLALILIAFGAYMGEIKVYWLAGMLCMVGGLFLGMAL
jgi:hypothetical protein